MVYPLLIQTLADDHIEEARRHAERTRRVRQARAENRPAREARKTARFPRLVTLRVAGLATRIPR